MSPRPSFTAHRPGERFTSPIVRASASESRGQRLARRAIFDLSPARQPLQQARQVVTITKFGRRRRPLPGLKARYGRGRPRYDLGSGKLKEEPQTAASRTRLVAELTSRIPLASHAAR
jgi:hypothetical protein